MIFLLLHGLTVVRALTLLVAHGVVEAQARTAGPAGKGGPMSANPTLAALLRAYVEGDRGARLALADWLEERGDPRAGAVRAARIDWDTVARQIYRGRNPASPHRRDHRAAYDWPELNRIRWWIDCALLGSGVPADVADAVRQAHRRWLAELFAEAG
jgi:uncharacterized protein (TIGR02996 family)